MKITEGLSCRVYRLLLIAYPSAFRHEYGYQMQQVFRDAYRDEARRNSHFALAGYWLRTLLDLVLTAGREHSESLRKDHTFMSTLRRDIVSVLGCVAIIAIAIALLNYGKSHEVRSILFFGYTLDAIAVTGIIGNLIVFLLVKLTKWNSLRIALWTLLTVHVVLATFIAIIGPRLGPFSFGPILVAYVLSFLFWFGLHWAWHFSKTEPAKS